MARTTDLTTPFPDKGKTERRLLLLFIFLFLGEDVATRELLQTKTSLLSQWVIVKKINIHKHYGLNGTHGILRTRGVIWTTILMEGGLGLNSDGTRCFELWILIWLLNTLLDFIHSTKLVKEVRFVIPCWRLSLYLVSGWVGYPEKTAILSCSLYAPRRENQGGLAVFVHYKWVKTKCGHKKGKLRTQYLN